MKLNTQMKSTMSLAAAMGSLVLAATSANAAVIFTETFEDNDISGFSNDVETGWVKTSSAGLVDLDDAAQFTGTGQAAWTNGTQTTTASILSDVLAVGTTYTLSSEIAKRTDLGGTATIQLLAGTTVLDEVSATPTASDFSESIQLIFTPDGSHAGLIGQTLAIRIGVDSVQPAFDNVVLDATAVPEPSSTALLGLGGLALVFRRRK